MAFMIPEYRKEPFLVGDTEHCEGSVCPLSAWMNHAAIARNDASALRKAMDAFAAEHDLVRDTVEIVHDKYWCRLSAPGYIDCTDWTGPFDTLEQAKADIRDTFEVDPDTGADLTCDEESEAL